MKKIVFIIHILLNVVAVLSAEDDVKVENDQLLLAHVIFRHGDRSMLRVYPNDPYQGKEFWPDGIGQLTKAGKLRQYELGKYLRRRYYKLLGDGRYSVDKVYVQSSNKDRTLMSAAANLAGLFPPEKDEIWNEEMPNWLPIPIHTVPIEIDNTIAGERPCQRYEKALNDQFESPEFLTLVNGVKQYYELVENHSGFKNVTSAEFFFTWDSLNAEKWANLKLPEWTNEMMQPNNDVDNFIKQSFVFFWKTKEMQRIRSGYLIREMFERFTEKSESTLKPDRSLWIYSGHDTTIIGLLITLGLFEPHVPPFASSIFFELYRTKDDTFYVQLFYRNTTAEIIPPLNIPGCGVKCPLNKFYQLFKDFMPTTDIEIECKLPESTESAKESNTWSNQDLIIPICCSVVVLLSTIYGWRKQTVSDAN